MAFVESFGVTRTTVQIELHSGRLEVMWPGVATTGVLKARVVLTNGAEHVSERWRRPPDSRDDRAFEARCGPATVRASIRAAAGRARVDLQFQASTAFDAVELGL